MSDIQVLKLCSTLFLTVLVWGLASILSFMDFETKRPITRDRNR